MKYIKKLFGYTILVIIVLLIMYISYFEFIYKTDLVTYFKINLDSINEIEIQTNTYAIAGNSSSKKAITSKEEIIEIINKISKYPIKKKVYRKFKYDKGFTIQIPSNSYSSNYNNYNIIIKLPNSFYDVTIYYGKCIHVVSVGDSVVTEWFDIIGDAFNL